MSTDVERIVQGLQFVHETVLSFFTFSIAMWLLERQLGVGAIAPIVVAVCKPRYVLYAFAHEFSLLMTDNISYNHCHWKF